MSIISNFKKLAKNDLRRKALEIAEAGYEAIDIKKAMNSKIKVINGKTGEFLIIDTHNKKEKINLNNYKRVFLVGIGKGSALASAALAKILGNKLNGGIALDVNKQKNLGFRILNFEFLTGTHPLPSEQNIEATQKIIKLAKNLKKDDLLITLICGGGSALLCGSEKELKASQTVFKELTKAGANIKELNTIRKHLSEVKGGGLAKLAYPATVISLVVSDVCGNDLSFVSSGPMVFDKTTKKDAEVILRKYNLQPTTYNLQLTETPKDKKYFKKVKNILFVCNQDAITAMLKKAEKLGFSAKIYSLALQGEAMNALLPMIKMAKQKQVIIAAGETTVNLKNKPKGKGGRNTEAALGAINSLNSNIVIMSFTSDGRDNTEAAGAIADALTLRKAEKLKINPTEFLKQNKSFAFFDKTGDLIYAEKKCFNVADLMLVLKA